MAGLFWTQEQDIGPSARGGHATAFDSDHHRVVLFGGDSLRSTLFGDTWAWDGKAWTQVGDTGPSPRTGHHLVYDSAGPSGVLFGGRSSSGALNGDTWMWDGELWTQVADTGPDPRTGLQMAFDMARSQVVLFGGEAAGNALRRDTWEWDGQVWTQRDDTGPTARRQHALTFDSTRGRVVLFGGDTGGTTVGDTWEWDGTSWTQVADTGPDPCAGAAMTFDGSAVLLFGGTESIAASNPPPRLFGLTWQWDGQHWTALQDIGPAPRWGHTIAFDSNRGRLVLFGGVSVPPGDPNAADHALADTWETAAPEATATGEVQLTSIAITPDTVTAAVLNTSPSALTLSVGLDHPAPANGVMVDIAVSNAGVELGTLGLPVPASSSGAQMPNPLVSAGLPAADYQFEGKLGNSTQTATLHVT